jgi:putative ABC transport system ATP-binding protein
VTDKGTLIRFAGVTKVYLMGELVVVLGPSGSGKTTFLNLIGGMDNVTSGSLVVNGSDIYRWSYKQLTEYRRTQIEFVFQFFNLMDTLTALENVELPLELVRKNGNGTARKALESVAGCWLKKTRAGLVPGSHFAL